MNNRTIVISVKPAKYFAHGIALLNHDGRIETKKQKFLSLILGVVISFISLYSIASYASIN